MPENVLKVEFHKTMRLLWGADVAVPRLQLTGMVKVYVAGWIDALALAGKDGEASAYLVGVAQPMTQPGWRADKSWQWWDD
jgi:hypothetical protein